jgi:hypothetical protein
MSTLTELHIGVNAVSSSAPGDVRRLLDAALHRIQANHASGDRFTG